MATKLYAWTRILHDGSVAAKPGDEVSQSSLKLDDDAWQQLVESNAVKSVPYPTAEDGLRFGEAPHQFMLRQIFGDRTTGEAPVADHAMATAIALSNDPTAVVAVDRTDLPDHTKAKEIQK